VECLNLRKLTIKLASALTIVVEDIKYFVIRDNS